MRTKNNKDNPAYKAFAYRFRKAVENSGLQQNQIADLTGMTETTVSRYVNGERIPHPILLAKLCEVLRCDANWLIGKEEPKQDWIPVDVRLPVMGQSVFATCVSKIDNRDDWVIDTCYIPLSEHMKNPMYSDWGNIPMLNSGDAEVIAWMPNDYPEPYKAESEE